MNNSDNTVGNLITAKRKRQKRYEEKTLNKPCTVRAHPIKHPLIKKFAKTGQCNSCQKHLELTVKLKKKLSQNINGPIKWTDQLTHRDTVLSSTTASFVVAVFILYNFVNGIFM